MPVIPNFPEDLLDQHHHWHQASAHPEAGPGRVHAAGTPGGGLEFLTFHRNFTAQFHTWYDVTTFTNPAFNTAAKKAQLVAPWYTVPAALQQPAYGWNSFADDAARLDSGSPDFATADELGTYIELGIHNNYLHGAASQAYNEPVLASLHSPQITQFYGIHGLVDHWWAMWQRRHKRFLKELMKEVIVEVDFKRLRDVVIDDRVLKRIGDVKTASLEVPEEILGSIDPVVLQGVSTRLERLERQAFPGKAFLTSEHRPQVAEVQPKRGRQRKPS